VRIRWWSHAYAAGLVVVSLAVLLIAAPFAALAGPERLRDFVYREVAYRVIVDRVTAGLTDDTAVAAALFDFVSTRVDAPRTQPAADLTVWDDLLRGIAWCDQQAWDLSTLLARKNIPSTILMLRGYDAETHHTVASAYLDGRWRILDPFWALVFRRRSGAPATFADLRRPDLRDELASAKLDAIAQFDPAFGDRYFRLFEPTHPPTQWLPLTYSDRARRLARRAIDFYAGMLDTLFVHRFQDAYLLRRHGKQGDGLYWRARHYDLFFRRELALESYQRFLRDSPQSPHREDALYFLGRLQQDLGDWRGSIRTLDLVLAETGVTPKWLPFAHFYLGLALEQVGDEAAAADAYWLAAPEAQVDAAARLLALIGRHRDRRNTSVRVISEPPAVDVNRNVSVSPSSVNGRTKSFPRSSGKSDPSTR
jgi:tetratricopeptide (TPR) repeat protein